MIWDEVNARARGLGGRLLKREDLESLARIQNLRALAAALRRLGYAVQEEGDGLRPEAIETAVRRAAGDRLRTLARWCGRRAAVAAVVFEDQDRENLRLLLRGVAQKASEEDRLRGVIPTRSLPESLLRELARQESPAAIAALLARWGHPYAAAVASARENLGTDLLLLELAIVRRFAERATRGARLAGGGGLLATYVCDLIDLENVLTVLLLAADRGIEHADRMFIPWGRRIERDLFLGALQSRDPAAAASSMARALRGTPFADPIARYDGDLGCLERLLLASRIRYLRTAAIRQPLEPASLLLYHLRLQSQVTDLQRIIWAAALEAPFPIVVAEFVTP